MYPTLINIKGMLFRVMVTKLCVFTTDLVNLCSICKVKINLHCIALKKKKKTRKKYFKK